MSGIKTRSTTCKESAQFDLYPISLGPSHLKFCHINHYLFLHLRDEASNFKSRKSWALLRMTYPGAKSSTKKKACCCDVSVTSSDPKIPMACTRQAIQEAVTRIIVLTQTWNAPKTRTEPMVPPPCLFPRNQTPNT